MEERRMWNSVSNTEEFEPIVIVGAPRSGTNMLRDVLCSLPDVGTWPCDEINYIWRHGNVRHPDDEFAPEQVTPAIQTYIRRQFERLAHKQNVTRVVEKTCANSLRVNFVDRVIPNAKYIFLVRDGRDVIASAMRRWTASLDVGYIAKKARFVPLTDLPYYALRYGANRIHQIFSPENRLASWGPRFQGMQQMLTDNSLAEVCAAQWARSVAKARQELEEIDRERVIEVKYEDFVGNPLLHLGRLIEFLTIPATESHLQQAIRHVSTKSIGNGQKTLDNSSLARLAPLMNEQLKGCGYQAIATQADGLNDLASLTHVKAA